MSEIDDRDKKAVPFFARFLEGQHIVEMSEEESEAIGGGREGNDDIAVTLKYPSDNEDDGIGVTEKFPSDAEDDDDDDGGPGLGGRLRLLRLLRRRRRRRRNGNQ